MERNWSPLRAPLRAHRSNFPPASESISVSGCECISKASKGSLTPWLKAAKKSGMGMVDEPEIAIAMKLPPEFVAISLDTHQKFDALAQEAAEGGTKVGALTHIGEILANCTACHATYRLSPQ